MHRNGIVSLGRVKSLDVFKRELFQYVSEGKHKKIQSFLAGHNSHVDDYCNTSGQTPLFVSCCMGHTKCVVILLSLGANPNRRSDDGSTPTHAAALSCVTDVLTACVEHGGDLRLHDNNNRLPRDWAVEAGQKKNKKILHYIDQLQSDICVHLFANNLLTNTSSSSLSRILTKGVCQTSLGSQYQTPNQRLSAINNKGYGDFAAIKCIDECPNKNENKLQIGAAALIPIVKFDQLSSAGSPSQAPPQFVMTEGKWGLQVVTLKTCKQGKKKHASKPIAYATDLLVHELKISGLLRHPNILLLVAICYCNGQDSSFGTNCTSPLVPYCSLYEHVSLGSLYHLLHERKLQLSRVQQVSLLQQMTDAISYLHQQGFIHCCISSHAIYMCNWQTAKLADFYYTLHRKDGSQMPNPISPVFNRWLAPELLVDKRPCIESDIYGFCVVACETISGILPWKAFDVDSVRHQIVSMGRMLLVPPVVPKLLHDVLQKGLSVSRSKRTTQLHEIDSVLKVLKKTDICLHESTDVHTLGFSNYMQHEESSPKARYLSDKVEDALGIDQPDSCAFQTTQSQPIVEGAGDLKQRRSFNSGATLRTPDYPTSSFITSQQRIPGAKTTMSLSTSSPQQSSAMSQACGALKSWNQSELQSINFRERDDVAGIIHQDLLDTDSLDSSLVACSDEGIRGTSGAEYCQQFANEAANTTFEIFKSESAIEVLTTEDFDKILCSQEKSLTQCRQETFNEADSNHIGNVNDRSSPYPDLSDCKNSPGEYVLSGMSSQADSLHNELDEERMSLSFTNSYLGSNYHAPVPVAAFTQPPPQVTNALEWTTQKSEASSLCTQDSSKNRCGEHNSTLPPRPTSGGCKEKNVPKDSPGAKSCHRYSKQRQRQSDETANEKLEEKTDIAAANVTSPLHCSVKKIEQSLEEFSKFLKVEPLTGEQNTMQNLEADNQHQDFVKENVFHVDGNEAETSNFVDEVLSAAGISSHVAAEAQEQNSSAQTKVFVTNSIKNGLYVGKAAKSKTKKYHKVKRKKATKCPNRSRLNSKEQTQSRNEILPEKSPDSEVTTVKSQTDCTESIKSVEVIYSNLPENESVKESPGNMSLSCQERTEIPSDNKNVPNLWYSDQPKFVPQPSAENTVTLEALFSQFANRKSENCTFESDNKEKRFSITSEDLVEIFADFADRKAFLEVPENAQQMESNTVADIEVDQLCNEVAALAVADGKTLPSVEESKERISVLCPAPTTQSRASQTSPNGNSLCTKPKPISAMYPPSITDFLSRTGDWSLIAVPSDKIISSCSQLQKKEVQYSDDRETPPGTKIAKCIQVCIPSACPEVVKVVLGEDKGGTKTPPIFDMCKPVFDVTPSKWTFKQKLSAFEAKSAEKVPQPHQGDSQRKSTVNYQRQTQYHDDGLAQNFADESSSAEDKNATPIYVTALEKEADESKLIRTPAHQANGLAQMLCEKGVKTSTPVMTKGVNIQCDKNGMVLLDPNANLNASYTDLQTANNKMYGSLPQGENYNPSDLVPTEKNNESVLTSSLMQMSYIPRSPLLSNISMTSNATTEDEYKAASKISASKPLEVAKHVEGIGSSGTSVSDCTGSESTDSNKGINAGINLLTKNITNSVLSEQVALLKDENSRHTSKQAVPDPDSSCKFVGISYDEDILSPAQGSGLDALECDTSVWLESQTSSNIV